MMLGRRPLRSGLTGLRWCRSSLAGTVTIRWWWRLLRSSVGGWGGGGRRGLGGRVSMVGLVVMRSGSWRRSGWSASSSRWIPR